MCEHGEVLFVPIEAMTDSSNYPLSFASEPKFICVACKEYVSRPTNRDRIVNVPKYDPRECTHPDKIHALSPCYFCLNCGSTWPQRLLKLDIKTDPDWEEKDERFRETVVNKWLKEEGK